MRQLFLQQGRAEDWTDFESIVLGLRSAQCAGKVVILLFFHLQIYLVASSMTGTADEDGETTDRS